MIATGTLSLDYRTKQVWDGVVWYKVLSPSLLYRLIEGKHTRKYISGTWISFNQWIIWFKKDKFIYRHFKIEERGVYGYHRGIMYNNSVTAVCDMGSCREDGNRGTLRRRKVYERG